MMLIGNSFTIRPIQTSDLAQALEVYRQCEDFLALGPDPRASLEMIKKDMRLSKEAGGVFCGIFDNEERIIGVEDFVPKNFEGNPKNAFIELLMIAKPARHKGLGTKVVSLVENEISRDPQVEKILSAVQVNNPDARSFWKKVGYQIVSGPIPCADGTTVFSLLKVIERNNKSGTSCHL